MVALSHLFTYFNSRPHGGRLFYRKLALRPHYFNSRPHGGRQGFCRRSGGCPDFNSRPHGGRRGTARNVPQNSAFQLTPSRRATHIIYCKLRMFKISTHALTEGDSTPRTRDSIKKNFTQALTDGDSKSVEESGDRANFNSRPHGGRQRQPQPLCRLYISTHALTEGDAYKDAQKFVIMISTHALTEGDPWSWNA